MTQPKSKSTTTKRPPRDRQVSIRITTDAFDATQKRAYEEGRSIADVFNLFASAYGNKKIDLPIPTH